MSTLVSHEIPKALFPHHDFFNDYPYTLAHLLSPKFETYDKEYADFYKKALNRYSYSILDNSAFELGDAINADILYEIGEEFKPSHIIIPDALHNRKLTQKRAMEYIVKYGDKSTPKLIGVLQGETKEELIELYQFYCSIPQIDIIAVPFDLYTPENWWETVQNDMYDIEDIDENIQIKDLHEYKIHRVSFVTQLVGNYYGKLPKKLHLLGCATPNEFIEYEPYELNNIHSIDTSAPIIYGWNNIKFDDKGVDLNVQKPKEKLADNLDIKLNSKQLDTITHNIRQFKHNLYK